jgi:general secretion pathway protein G
MRWTHWLPVAVMVASISAGAVIVVRSKPHRTICLITPERAEILRLDHACPLFEADVGRIPMNLDALLNPPRDEAEKAKWAGPYVEKINLDPWGHPYRCQGDGKSKPRIWSIGPDGINGTADDISNDQ